MKHEALMEQLEDIYDALIADLAYEEYLKNPQTRNIKEVAKEYGITDESKLRNEEA